VVGLFLLELCPMKKSGRPAHPGGRSKTLKKVKKPVFGPNMAATATKVIGQN
jgi:hypothetical protein